MAALLSTLEITLRWIWIAADLMLLLLLFRRRLLPAYRWFAFFLSVELVQMVAGVSYTTDSPSYFRIWACTEILLMLFAIGASLEVTRKILGHYPQLSRFASSTFGVVFLGGVIAATVLAFPFFAGSKWDLNGSVRLSALFFGAMKLLRWESVMIFLFLAAQAFWFYIFPIRMKGNVSLHRWILALYVGAVPAISAVISDSLPVDAHTVGRDWNNIGLMAGEILLLFVWMLRLTPDGEKEPNLFVLIDKSEVRLRSAEYADAVRRVERDLDY